MSNTNHTLEHALGHAGRAGDIDSLKALARQESARADRITQLLMAVLAEAGPVRVPDAALQNFDRNKGGYSLTQDGTTWVIKLTK